MTFPGAVTNAVESLPATALNVGKYTVTHPPLSAKNFQKSTIGQGTIGAAETLADLANAPHAMAQYLQSKGVNPFVGTPLSLIPGTQNIPSSIIPSIPVKKIESGLVH